LDWSFAESPNLVQCQRAVLYVRGFAMTRLRGHFDGRTVVLDEPLPPELAPNTLVEVVIIKTREQVLREFIDSVRALWARPLPPDFQPTGRQWKREDLYERGGKPLA
jgi:hypothetical protein